MIRRTVKLAAVAAAFSLALTGCASDNSDDGGSPDDSGKPVRIGVVGEQNEQWPVFVEKAKEAGIEVELVNFTQYPEPNPALSSEQLDLNQFQHLQYLADYNVASDDDLVPIGATAIYPLALYSLKHDSVEDIPDGAEIAVPNDPTNLARALFVLEGEGLLKLEAEAGSLATEIDVVEEESRVTVTAVDPAQTPAALESVDGSIINNDFVQDAGLDPTEAIAQDDASSPAAQPFINIWVARNADKDNETYLKLVEIAHDAEVEEALINHSGGTAVVLDLPGEELTGYLKDIEEDLKAEG